MQQAVSTLGPRTSGTRLRHCAAQWPAVRRWWRVSKRDGSRRRDGPRLTDRRIAFPRSHFRSWQGRYCRWSQRCETVMILGLVTWASSTAARVSCGPIAAAIGVRREQTSTSTMRRATGHVPAQAPNQTRGGESCIAQSGSSACGGSRMASFVAIRLGRRRRFRACISGRAASRGDADARPRDCRPRH